MQAFRRNAASALRNAAATQRRAYSAGAYADTVKNLRINGDTKVIYQGFTGKQGTCVLPGICGIDVWINADMRQQFPRRTGPQLRYAIYN